MSISGRVNIITDPKVFFGQILVNGKPTSGFVPAKNIPFDVEMVGIFDQLVVANEIQFIPIPISAKVNPVNGFFICKTFPQN